jgi:hypothetical protein
MRVRRAAAQTRVTWRLAGLCSWHGVGRAEVAKGREARCGGVKAGRAARAVHMRRRALLLAPHARGRSVDADAVWCVGQASASAGRRSCVAVQPLRGAAAAFRPAPLAPTQSTASGLPTSATSCHRSAWRPEQQAVATRQAHAIPKPGQIGQGTPNALAAAAADKGVKAAGQRMAAAGGALVPKLEPPDGPEAYVGASLLDFLNDDLLPSVSDFQMLDQPTLTAADAACHHEATGSAGGPASGSGAGPSRPPPPKRILADDPDDSDDDDDVRPGKRKSEAASAAASKKACREKARREKLNDR